MATIQIRRQLKYAHPKKDALNYIRTKLTMTAGEPLLCTYRNGNGKWSGAIEVICVYPSGTLRANTILTDSSYDNYFDEDNKLINNFLKVNDNEWDKI
jgi:hypothetical protein